MRLTFVHHLKLLKSLKLFEILEAVPNNFIIIDKNFNNL